MPVIVLEDWYTIWYKIGDWGSYLQWKWQKPTFQKFNAIEKKSPNNSSKTVEKNICQKNSSKNIVITVDWKNIYTKNHWKETKESQ